MSKSHLSCFSFCIVAVVVGLSSVSASPTGVGLLESMSFELVQGGSSILSYTNIPITNLDGTVAMNLGAFGSSAHVTLKVNVDDPANPSVVDRHLELTINGVNDADNSPFNLFNPAGTGNIEIRVTDMHFSNVDGISSTRVRPFEPYYYNSVNQPNTPIFYLFDEQHGFVNLPGSQQFTPPVKTSVQVASGNYYTSGYTFDRVPTDANPWTGFSIGAIPQFDGMSLTPISLTPPPYFEPVVWNNQQICSEIGISLNMEAYEVPEPASLGLLGLGMLFIRARRRR